MLSSAAVQETEETIRQQVREWPDEKRLRFYTEVEKKLKDPDTYATLNYIFIAGLHHFYIGRWLYGLVNIAVFWLGVLLLFTDPLWLGILLIAGVTLLELYELFRSQLIVQQYNNQVMQETYQSLLKQAE